MSLLWMDGFDRYGTVETEMTDGPWSEVSLTATLVSASPTPRTGGFCLQLANNTGSIARRQFGAAKTTVGLGFAVYFDALPLNNGRCSIEFRDAANAANLTLVVQSTGAVAAYRGDTFGTLLGTSSALVTAASWNHLEAKVKIDNTTGTVEVRLNGVTILNLTGVDTCNTANVETSQVAFRQNGSAGAIWSLDDAFAWDTAGSTNNDFIGDKKVYCLMPTADTAEADWTKSTGVVGWSLIDEIPASFTDYIQSAVVTDRSDFDCADLDAGVVSVAAINVFCKALKTDAGTCTIKNNVQSNGSTGTGTDRPLTTAGAYYDQIFESNPDGSIPWTPATVNAAQISFVRVA